MRVLARGGVAEPPGSSPKGVLSGEPYAPERGIGSDVSELTTTMGGAGEVLSGLGYLRSEADGRAAAGDTERLGAEDEF